MSTPTDQFARLSISSGEDPMAPSDEEVKQRALELRDILSSFDENRLPIEFQRPIFSNITGRRPPPLRLHQSEWTIPGNLPGTLLQWGAYNEQGWTFLRQIQSPTSRAIAFYEKLSRRFEQCFDEYDRIATIGSAPSIKDRVEQVAEKLEVLSDSIYEARSRFEERETETLGVALSALRSICERTEMVLMPPPPGAETPRKSVRLSESFPGLFTVVIRRSSSTNSPYMLDALELFSNAALKACLSELVTINGYLNRNRAGDVYIHRFEALQQKAHDDTGKSPETASASKSSGGRTRGLEADPRPGSKRPLTTPEVTPKRGKRTGGK